MPKKQRKFADDGWAVWIDGDDVSTIYITIGLIQKGKVTLILPFAYVE